MKIEAIPASELSDDLCLTWQQFQASNPFLRSPYFCHEYISTVARIRDDVYISVIEDNNDIVGFFPFQRRWSKVGRPVGGIVSDYQGLITDTDLMLDLGWLLKSSGLVRWNFDHLVVEQSPFLPYHRRLANSPIIDLSEGFDSYKDSRRKAGSKLFEQVARKRRKLEREVGPIRYESHVTSFKVLSTCMKWKSEQYRRSGILDLFSFDWPVNLLREINQTRSDDFAGMLSGLWAGDNLVAVHMGMRSRDIWHYWFPTYAIEIGKYSPGLILLLDMAKAAPSLGIKAIDLGKGDSRYKSQLANSEATVCEGHIELPSFANNIFNFVENTVNWINQNPKAPWLARLPARVIRKYHRWERDH